MAINKLKMKQRIEVYEFMKDKVKKLEDGSWEYIGEWDDKKIAEKFRTSLVTIRGTRQELFGKLKKPQNLDELTLLRKDLDRVMGYLTRKNPNWREL